MRLFLFCCFVFVVVATRHKKYLCPKEHALSGLKRTLIHEKEFWFSISCTKIEHCNETCEWSNKCTIDRYGNGLYIGGIAPHSDVVKNRQYFTFLCCNGSQVEESRCSPLVNYTSENFETPQSKNRIIRQAMSDDSSMTYVGVETCIYDKLKSRKRLACLLPTKRETITTSHFVPISLAGLAGLGIIKILETKRTTTLAPVCTCKFYCDQCKIGCLANGGFFCDTFGFCGFPQLPCA